MRNIVSQRSRSGRSGFVRVGRTDTDETEQRQLSGRARFRETVQQVLQQTPFAVSHNPNPPSAQSSPALSDTSIINEDYMSLPTQQFDEVDLADTHGGYAEMLGSYGPEVVDNSDPTSDFYSTKAEKGLEVLVKSYPLDLSPGGLCVDDGLRDYSYRGSEGIIEKPITDFPSLYNYRPVPLRWRFILIALGGLVTFLVLSELALRFLPDASDMDEFLPAFQNISEIRKRSGNDGVGHGEHFAVPNNDTQSDIHVPSEVSLTTAVSTSTKTGSSTETSRATDTTSITSTMKTISTASTTPTTSITKVTSTTETTFTKGVTKTTLTTSVVETTEAASTTSTTGIISTPETSATTETTSIASMTSTVEATSTILTVETSSTTELSSPPNVETQPTSPIESSIIETVTASTSKVQDGQSSVTISPITEVTVSENKPSETPTLSLSQPEESQLPGTEYPHYTTTEQHTADPTPNAPGPGDHPSPNEPISSTQTEAEVTDHETLPILLPIPSPSADTTSLQHTVDLPPNPTIGPPLGTANGQSPNITSSYPLPGIGAKPTDGSLPGPDPTNSPLPPGSSTTSPDKQATAQGSSKPDDVKPPDSLYPTNDQPKAQPTDEGKGQPGDQPGRPNNDNIGASPSSIHSFKPVVTSARVFPTIDVTRTTGDKTDSSSSPAPLSELPEQDLKDNEKPFTTFTLTEATETPPPLITTVFTTSSISGGRFVEVTMMTTIFGHIKADIPLTDYIRTTTYANGMVSTISKSVYDHVETEFEYDPAGKPTKTLYKHVLHSSQKTILRDSLGYPTATLGYYDVESTATLYNSDHIATATVLTTIPETTTLSTIFDANGRPIKTTILLRPIVTYSAAALPTPTSTPSSGSNNQRTLELHRLSEEIYFVGLMLPTLLTILLFIPIRILHRNIKLYQGFHVLASDRGASAAESLCLRTTGPSSLLDGLRSLRRGNYLLGLTSVLVVLSALAVPFSAEVFRLILQGPQCHSNESDRIKCSVALGVFPAPAQVLSALLIALSIGVVLVAVLLRRWKTGVEWDPWNILHMSQLAAGTDIRKVLERIRRHRRAGMHVDPKEFINRLRGKTLGLRGWEENGAWKYSVLILTKEVEDLTEKPMNKAGRAVTFANPKNSSRRHYPRWLRGNYVPFSILSLTGRILFMFFLSGILIAVLTYDIVARGSEYRRGLTGNAVGVRFLFSGAGVVVTFAWGSFFDAVAFLSPYKLLRRRRLNKGEAIAVSPATNPFTGLWLAFIPSRQDLFLGIVAATAIVSEFLPLFLGNIPCNGVQLEIAETISVYLSVAVLSMMILIVGSSFFLEWPTTMGVDPSTIAGAMYIAHVLSVEQPLKRFFKNEVASFV